MAPADALAERLLKQFPPGHAYTVDDLRREGLPRALVHFIDQALQRRLVMEREVLDAARDGARSPWFDAEATPVQAAWRAYFDALAATARVPADEWPHALRQAARQVTAFLLRPAPALTAFVFSDEQGELASDVILRRMTYFAAYPYLQEVVAAYVQERRLKGLDRRTFAGLLERLERHTPERYRGEAWKTLLADLFDTLGTGSPAAMPGPLIAPLFADKGLNEVAGRLAAAPAPVTLAEVMALLSSPAPDAKPEAPSTTNGGPKTSEALASVRPEVPVKRPAPVAAPDEALERAEEIPPVTPQAAPVRAAEHPTSPGTQVPPPRPMRHAAMPEEAGEKRPLWQRFVPGRQESDPARTKDPSRGEGSGSLEARALGTLAPNQRQTILRQVFQDDTAAYTAALERLAAADTWTVAARTLLDVFQQQGIDLYDPAAIALTDAAEQRFLR